MLKVTRFVIIGMMMVLLLPSCATYYQKNQKFQSFVAAGDLTRAQAVLMKNEKAAEGKNKILYYLDDGWLKFMLKDYKGSIESFQTANNLVADYQKNYAMDALTLLTNPGILPYQANDVENVMINYYKSLDYIFQNNKEGALVEARQISNKLYQINDKYKKYKNHYSDDAFAHVLIGLLYESSNDFNNAFIAYRNALKVYDEVYATNFNLTAPLQLKKDILRTAAISGLSQEVAYFEKKFGMKYQPVKHDGGYLVFLWENGMGPIKDEWSINFTIIRGSGGVVTFVNEELGLSFPFPLGSSSKSTGDFGDLEFVRVAVPKYVERKPLYHQAYCEINGERFPLELAEDINAIEFKTLNDKMLRTLATSLLRLASKKAIEYAARNQNQNVGAAIGILNAITEKADTRNWQTLPHGISYVKIPIPVGETTFNFVTEGQHGQKQHSIKVNARKGQTVFYDFRSLESFPANGNY